MVLSARLELAASRLKVWRLVLFVLESLVSLAGVEPAVSGLRGRRPRPVRRQRHGASVESRTRSARLQGALLPGRHWHGAEGGSRTRCLRFTKPALDQLSFIGMVPSAGVEPARPCGHEVLSLASLPRFLHDGMVRLAGVEPARPFGHRILSPARLPRFRHSRVVGVRGFEPPVSCSRSTCLTRLGHTPLEQAAGIGPAILCLGSRCVTPTLRLR